MNTQMSLEELEVSQVLHITYSLIQVLAPSKLLVTQILSTLKKCFKQEVHKMFEAGVLKPVHEATPWINSFVLVKGKDKSGNLKLHICLDPTNLKWSNHKGAKPV